MPLIKFGTQNPIPYEAYEYGGLMVRLTAFGNITIDREVDATHEDIIRSNAILGLQQAISSLNSKQVRCLELHSHTQEINDAVKQKLESAGYDCSVQIKSISIDEESKKMISKIQRMNNIDPAANAIAEANAAVQAARAQAAGAATSRPKFCPNCGIPTGASGNFCGNCGARLA